VLPSFGMPIDHSLRTSMYFANTNFQSLWHARYLETIMTDADKRQKLNRQKPNVQTNNVDTIRKSNNKRPLLYDLVYP
jgi:hypothetical protein